MTLNGRRFVGVMAVSVLGAAAATARCQEPVWSTSVHDLVRRIKQLGCVFDDDPRRSAPPLFAWEKRDSPAIDEPPSPSALTPPALRERDPFAPTSCHGCDGDLGEANSLTFKPRHPSELQDSDSSPLGPIDLLPDSSRTRVFTQLGLLASPHEMRTRSFFGVSVGPSLVW